MPRRAELNNQISEEERQSPEKSNNVSYSNGVYLFAALFLCVISSLPLILVPQNNDINFWENRNDISAIMGRVVNNIFGFPLISTFHLMFECKILLKLKSALTFQVFGLLYVTKLLGFVILPNLAMYLIWNIALGNDNVMPFNAYLGLIGFPIPYIVLWYYYPKEFRFNTRGRRKFRAYLYYKVWRNFAFIPYLLSAIIIRILPYKFQWVLAILLPLNKEIDYYLSTKMLSKSIGLLDKSSIASITVTVNSVNALHVAITIGKKATTFTSCCILAVDFVMNIRSSYKIMRLHNQIETDHLQNQKRVFEKKQELRKLTLIETVEMMVPISYIMTFLIAYHGPNADLFGNVKAVDDVGIFVGTVFWMFLVDFSSGIFGGLLLSTSSINLLREGCDMLREYWPIIGLTVASCLYVVSCFTFIVDMEHYKCLRFDISD